MATDVQTTPQAPLTAAGLLGLLGGGYTVPSNPLAALGGTGENSVGSGVASLIPGFDPKNEGDAFKASQLLAGLAGMGQGFLAAGEPSRFPVPRGRAMGLAFQGALQGMSGAATAALQNRFTMQELQKGSLNNIKTSLETQQAYDQANYARRLAGLEPLPALPGQTKGGVLSALANGPPEPTSRSMGIVPPEQLRAQTDRLLAAPSTSSSDDPLPPTISEQRQTSTPIDVGARYPYLPDDGSGTPHGTPDGSINYPKGGGPLSPDATAHAVGAALARTAEPERILAIAQGKISSHDPGELQQAIVIAGLAGKIGEPAVAGLQKQLETELAQRAASRRYDPQSGVYGDTPRVAADKNVSSIATTAGGKLATVDPSGRIAPAPGSVGFLEAEERRKLLGMAPTLQTFWNPKSNQQVSVDTLHNPGLVAQLTASGYQPMGKDEKTPDIANALTARTAAATKIGDQGGIPTFGPAGQPTGSQPIGNVASELAANKNDETRLAELSTRQDTLTQARQSIDHLKMLISDPALKTGKTQEATTELRRFINDWAPGLAPGLSLQQSFAAAVVNSLGPLRATLGVQQVRGPEIAFLEKAAAGGIGDTLPAIRANTLALDKQVAYSLNQISHVQSEKGKGVHVSDSLKSYTDNTPAPYSSPETKAAIQSALDPTKVTTPHFDDPAQLRDWVDQHKDYLTPGQQSAAERIAKKMAEPNGPNQTGKPYPVTDDGGPTRLRIVNGRVQEVP